MNNTKKMLSVYTYLAKKDGIICRGNRSHTFDTYNLLSLPVPPPDSTRWPRPHPVLTLTMFQQRAGRHWSRCAIFLTKSGNKEPKTIIFARKCQNYNPSTPWVVSLWVSFSQKTRKIEDYQTKFCSSLWSHAHNQTALSGTANHRVRLPRGERWPITSPLAGNAHAHTY